MIERAKELLATGEYTCVVCGEGVTVTATERGVKPLASWLDSKVDLRGCCAADKVVGKATAFLYCLLGVRQVYGRVISVSALEALLAHGIGVEYDVLAPYIVNRAGDGMCPFEEAVGKTDDPETAWQIIRDKLSKM